MNVLDIVLLVLLVPGILHGILKGFLGQAITLGGVLISIYIACTFADAVCMKLKEFITMQDTVLHIISFVLILCVVLLIVLYIGKLITDVVEMAALGWFNRLLGGVFALITSTIVLGLIIMLFEPLNAKFALVNSDILSGSFLYGHIRDLGYLIFPYLKQIYQMAV